MKNKQYLNETQRCVLQDINNLNEAMIDACAQGEPKKEEVKKVFEALMNVIDNGVGFPRPRKSAEDFIMLTMLDWGHRENTAELIRLSLNLNRYFQFALGRLDELKYENSGELTEEGRREVAKIIKGFLLKSIKKIEGMTHAHKRQAIAIQQTPKSSVITRCQEKALFQAPPSKRAKKTCSHEEVERFGPTLRCS